MNRSAREKAYYQTGQLLNRTMHAALGVHDRVELNTCHAIRVDPTICLTIKYN